MPGGRAAPAVWFGAAAAVAFFRTLFLGQAYFANDLLYFFGPMRQYLRDRLAAGDVPLWNPHLFGGIPFLADLQNLFFYPLNWPTLLFPVGLGLSVFQALHCALAGAGARAFLRALKIPEGPACTGGLVLAFSHFYWWELIHPPVLAAFAWIPWLFWAVERLCQDPAPRRAFAAGLAFALLFLAGSLQVTLGAFYGALAYLAFRLAARAGGWRRVLVSLRSPAIWKNGTRLVLFSAWGALPLLCQLVPTAEFSAHTHRREGSLPYEFNAQFNLQPSTLWQFLFPFHGVPEGDTVERLIQATQDWLANFGYVGIWFPFLAFLALRRREESPPARLLAALGAVSLLVALGKYTPMHRLVTEWLPGFSLIRVAFRFLYLYVFAAACLTAFGLWRLERETEGKEGRRLAAAGLAYAGVMLLFALTDPAGTWREILALLSGSAALLLLAHSASFRTLGRRLFQGALTVPLLLSGWATFATGPSSNLDFQANLPDLARVAEEIRPGRVAFQSPVPYLVRAKGGSSNWALPDNACMVFGLRTVGGYNPLSLKKVEEVRGLRTPAVLDLFHVRGFLSGRDLGEPEGFRRHPFASFLYYERIGAAGPVRFPERVIRVSNREEALSQLEHPEFDPRRETVLETTPGAPFPVAGAGGGKARLTEASPDRQVWNVSRPQAGLAVFSEIAYPGWRASVDGAPAEIHTADRVFRAVEVPAGESTVIFEFQPAWWTPARVLALLWAASLLFLLKVPIRNRLK